MSWLGLPAALVFQLYWSLSISSCDSSFLLLILDTDITTRCFLVTVDVGLLIHSSYICWLYLLSLGLIAFHQFSILGPRPCVSFSSSRLLIGMSWFHDIWDKTSKSGNPYWWLVLNRFERPAVPKANHTCSLIFDLHPQYLWLALGENLGRYWAQSLRSVVSSSSAAHHKDLDYLPLYKLLCMTFLWALFNLCFFLL